MTLQSIKRYGFGFTLFAHSFCMFYQQPLPAEELNTAQLSDPSSGITYHPIRCAFDRGNVNLPPVSYTCQAAIGGNRPFSCTGSNECEMMVSGLSGKPVTVWADSSFTRLVMPFGSPWGVSLKVFPRVTTLSKGPWLGNVTEDSVVVRWETSGGASEPLVRYATSPTAPPSWAVATKTCTAGLCQYLATLPGLSPGTQYRYSIEDLNIPEGGIFTTSASNMTQFRFGAFGDYQGGNSDAFKFVTEKIAALSPALCLNTGDMVNGSSMWNQFFSNAGKLLKTCPFFPGIGNNDDKVTWGQNFDLPGDGENTKYYSFNYANTHFIVLSYPNFQHYDDRDAQVLWLKSDLASTKTAAASNIVVTIHYGPYGYGGYNGNNNLRTLLESLFSSHPVLFQKLRFILSGHNHFYQSIAKTYTLNNMTRDIRFLVIGRAGTGFLTDPDPVCSTSDPNVKIWGCEKRFHSVVFDVNGTTIQGRAYDNTGLEFDSFISLTPQLVFKGTESYTVGGKQWVRYKLEIANRATIPTELFAAASDLPPCGLNPKASRTWVDIYNATTNQRLYGFCALPSPQNLDSLWFAVEKGTSPPLKVYVVFTDRRTKPTYTTYRSNSVSLQ